MRFMIAAILLVLLSGCGKEPNPFEKWYYKMSDKCIAMKGKRFYDADTKTFECYRAPIARMTKTLFKETYVDRMIP